MTRPARCTYNSCPALRAQRELGQLLAIVERLARSGATAISCIPESALTGSYYLCLGRGYVYR
jgi:hypothetical protein